MHLRETADTSSYIHQAVSRCPHQDGDKLRTPTWQSIENTEMESNETVKKEKVGTIKTETDGITKTDFSFEQQRCHIQRSTISILKYQYRSHQTDGLSHKPRQDRVLQYPVNFQRYHKYL